MTARGVAVAALAVALIGPTVASAQAPRLRAFDSCPQLVRYAAAHAKSAAPISGGPVATVTPTVAPQSDAGSSKETTTQAPAVSQTNVQEAGVDEPDVVKTDGTTLFVVSGSTLYAVDASTATPRIVGTATLPVSGGELLLHDGHALVVGQEAVHPVLPGPITVDGRVAGSTIAPYTPPRTVLASVDVHDPAHLTVGTPLTVDGVTVSSRSAGRYARVVVTSAPRYVAEPLLRRQVTGWVPTASSGSAKAQRIVGCGDVYRPPVFSGTDMTTVLTVDLDSGQPRPVSSAAVMADAQTVYASPDNLYVATQRWDPSTTASTTAIHRFATIGADTTYAASGSVAGSILSQWSLSEQDGVLRVASTGAHDSSVTTFNAALQPLGSVAGLGVDERIRGVRFIGDLGYVVTFRQTDPLYTVDLSDPRTPRVAGELQLLGYSAYLHPVGDGLLLGIGQDATDQGRTLGAQVSLFDVSDPAAPRRLDVHSLGANAYTAAESDHHAFLWWPATRLAVLPVTGSSFSGATGLRIGSSAIADAGSVAAPSNASFSRAVVVGDRVLLIDPSAGVQAAALDGLGAEGWLPFPTATPVVSPGGPVSGPIALPAS